MDKLDMIHNKPILVTGSPRSGTSWVGRMISQTPLVRYIHEPFNISNYPCHCGLSFNHWFHYLSSKESLKYFDHIKHKIYPAYSWVGLFNMVTEISRSKRIRSLFNYLRSYSLNRPVLKDPIGVFSAKTLADLFDLDVVVLIRHPAAIVSSYKALNWTHPFSDFLNQTELMEDHLYPFQSEIEEFVKNEHDIVDQAALLWKLIHHMIIRYQKTQDEWYFVQYESLALNPLDGYKKMFSHLSLTFSERIRLRIQNHALEHQSPYDVSDPYGIKQNPRLTVSKWKNKLTSLEIRRIRSRVEEVSSVFYSDKDWNFESGKNE